MPSPSCMPAAPIYKANPMLTWLQAQGTPQEIGLALGRWGARACHEHLIGSPAWSELMSWRGTPIVSALRAHTEQAFPWIIDEISGLSDGLGLPFEDVFVWNCRGDLWARSPDGCTTVLAPARLSHNEDGDPGWAGHCGLVEARPSKGPAFVSFVYPGSIPGHTFAVNQSGLAMTVNNIRARQAPAGMPRMVLTRAILATHTPDAALDLLRSHPRSGAFHLGLGLAGTPGTYSVEFSATAVSCEPLTQGQGVHANHAIHAAQADLAQIITASSQHRQMRGEALLARDIQALYILADQGDELEPIYRNSATDTDHENTMATADIDLGGPEVSWVVYASPQDAQYRFQGIRRI